MKQFELIINEDLETGVDYIALVDEPAIESDWIAFSKEKQAFKIEDNKKRIVSGYFMIADKPIYRNNEKLGEHYVVFRPDTIKQIQLKFMANNINNNTNLMHEQDFAMDDVVIFEHIIIDSERGVFAPDKFEKVPDGSWWGSMKIPESNTKLWDAIQDGSFRGFSVEGMFKYSNPEEMTNDQKMMKEIIELFEKYNTNI